VTTKTDAIDAVRGFNRFYTRQLGLLDRGLLGSEFTLTEARVMYELARRDDPLASDLAADLALDFGYLSRILKKFETRKLLVRKRSAADARQSVLRLSAKGRRAFATLNEAARSQVADLIAGLKTEQRAALLQAMHTVESVLGTKDVSTAFVVRDLKIGDIGWIVHRQGLLYSQEYGWDGTYEALVAEIAGAFAKNLDRKTERAWIAARGSQILGSVFLVRVSSDVAKLRLLYVEPAARGLGIGKHLVQACIQFAKQQGYKTLTLWTNDVLVAARSIYIAAGFTLVHEEPHHAFGQALISQTWELDLCAMV
jgi:DNA-binding MarR family transcriptional regulator/GNAT superfamily N-acetyltransferase